MSEDDGRERAAIIQDELTTRLSEQMNRNMYMLSVIAAIILLGFMEYAVLRPLKWI